MSSARASLLVASPLTLFSFLLFRVAYSSSHLEKLAIDASKKDSYLSVGDRFGLVSDTYALARSGFYSTVELLNLVEKVKLAEDNPIVWSAIATVSSPNTFSTRLEPVLITFSPIPGSHRPPIRLVRATSTRPRRHRQLLSVDLWPSHRPARVRV